MADKWTAERYGAPLVCMVRIWPGEEHNPLVIWPYEGETRPGTVCVWQPIGQHGAGMLRPDGTRPATHAEALEALRRWQGEDSANRPPPAAWRILRRSPPFHKLLTYWRMPPRQQRKLWAEISPASQGER